MLAHILGHPALGKHFCRCHGCPSLKIKNFGPRTEVTRRSMATVRSGLGAEPTGGAVRSSDPCGRGVGVWTSLPLTRHPPGELVPCHGSEGGKCHHSCIPKCPRVVPGTACCWIPQCLSASPDTASTVLVLAQTHSAPFQLWGGPAASPSCPLQSPWPPAGRSATGGRRPCPCCPCSGTTSRSQRGLDSQEKWPDQARGGGNLQRNPILDTGLGSQGRLLSRGAETCSSAAPWGRSPGSAPLGAAPGQKP